MGFLLLLGNKLGVSQLVANNQKASGYIHIYTHGHNNKYSFLPSSYPQTQLIHLSQFNRSNSFATIPVNYFHSHPTGNRTKSMVLSQIIATYNHNTEKQKTPDMQMRTQFPLEYTKDSVLQKESTGQTASKYNLINSQD